MNISQLLATPEGKTLGFKRDLSSPKPVLRTLVAFANTAGATLIIGRADDGAIVIAAWWLRIRVVADVRQPAAIVVAVIVLDDGPFRVVIAVKCRAFQFMVCRVRHLIVLNDGATTRTTVFGSHSTLQRSLPLRALGSDERR